MLMSLLIVHLSGVQDAEANYYKVQNKQLRSLLRRAGISEILEFQLVAAISEETTKLLTAEAPENVLQTEKEFNSENIVDFTSGSEVAENGSSEKVGTSCRPRPGNVFCLKSSEKTEISITDDAPDATKERENSVSKKLTNVENFPMGFEVSEVIKEALKQKVIEIVHKNTVKSAHCKVIQSMTSTQDLESLVRTEPMSNASVSSKPTLTGLSLPNEVSLSHNGNEFFAVTSEPENVSNSNETSSLKTPMLINTPNVAREVSNESIERPKLGGSNLALDRRGNLCNAKSQICPEQQRKTLPSIYSLTHMAETNLESEEMDQSVRSDIQEETSMDSSLRAPTLFDIDNLISSAPVGDSPPSLDQISDVQPLPTSGSTVDRANDNSMLSNVFSISSLTDEAKHPAGMQHFKDPKSRKQQQNDDASGHLSTSGQMLHRHENDTNVKLAKHNPAQGRSSQVNSTPTKSATHSVEYLMSSSVRPGTRSTNSYTSENFYNYETNKDLFRMDPSIRPENTPSYSSNASLSQDYRKRLTGNPSTAGNSFKASYKEMETVFVGEKSTKRVKSLNSTDFKNISVTSSKGPPVGKAPEPSLPQQTNWTPYNPNQVAGPAQLPFWEENMVVMPPQRLCAFQSQTNTQQSYSGNGNLNIDNASVNQISAYNTNNIYNPTSNNVIPANDSTNIDTHRTGQNFILSSFPNQNTSDVGSETGKYALQNRASFNDTLNQTLPPATFQYNNVTPQYPLEPQMLLQPLSSSEKWSMSNRNSSFSGFKDVDFMASNNTSYFPPGFTSTSNPNVFNPFFDGYNSTQTFTDHTSESNIQYSNTYQNLSNKRNDPTPQNQSHRVDKQQPQLQNRASSDSASSFPTSHKHSSTAANQQSASSTQTNQSAAPRHLIKNFVQTKNTSHNSSTSIEKSSSATVGNQECTPLSFDPSLNSRYQGSTSWVMPPPPVDSFYTQTNNQFLLPNSDLGFSQNFL